MHLGEAEGAAFPVAHLFVLTNNLLKKFIHYFSQPKPFLLRHKSPKLILHIHKVRKILVKLHLLKSALKHTQIRFEAEANAHSLIVGEQRGEDLVEDNVVGKGHQINKEGRIPVTDLEESRALTIFSGDGWTPFSIHADEI